MIRLLCLSLVAFVALVFVANPGAPVQGKEPGHQRFHIASHSIDIFGRWAFDEFGPNSTQIHLSYAEANRSNSNDNPQHTTSSLVSVLIEIYENGPLARQISANFPVDRTNVQGSLSGAGLHLSVPAQDCSFNPYACTPIILEIDVDWTATAPLVKEFNSGHTDYTTGDGERCKFNEAYRYFRRQASATGSIRFGDTEFTRGATATGEIVKASSKISGQGNPEICLP